MLKRSCAVLGTLLLAGGASAVSTITPTVGGNPRLVGQGKTVNVILELVTSDLVGSVNVEIFANNGLTLSCADASDVSAPAYNCSDIVGGIQVNASDFVSGLASGLDLVLLTITTPVGGNGASLSLGSVFPTPGSTNYRLCPTTLGNCLFDPPLGDGSDAPFTNDSADIVQVIPEPGSFGLVALGLLGLAARRR